MCGKEITGSVLITGGCGSVGSAVVDNLSSQHNAKEIVIYDNDERQLFDQRRNPDRRQSTVKYKLGDVRDINRLGEVMRTVDHVVHAAALKQVPQCERQPYESVKTNIEGTKNVIELAKRHGIDSVLTVSTDKATNPSSVMGASKLLAERVTLKADQHTGPDGPTFNSVRLGNVIGSSSSVVPVFLKQIEEGGPVTLTDPGMTRFVISRAHAAQFIVEHVATEPAGVTYLPELKSLRIETLADIMVDMYAYRAPSGDITVEETGRRPGERLHEIMISPDERHRAVKRDGEYVVMPPGTEGGTDINKVSVPEHGLSSRDATELTPGELRQMLREFDESESIASASVEVSSTSQKDD